MMAMMICSIIPEACRAVRMITGESTMQRRWGHGHVRTLGVSACIMTTHTLANAHVQYGTGLGHVWPGVVMVMRVVVLATVARPILGRLYGFN